MWVVLNIISTNCKVIWRTRLKGVQSQHPINWVSLITHSNTSLVKNSDYKLYKTQKPCKKNTEIHRPASDSDVHWKLINLKCLSPLGSRDQLSMNLWVWNSFVDFKLESSLQGFSVLYNILSEFLTKHVLECVVNQTYLTECCDCTLFNLLLKTTLCFVLIFSATHKMGFCKYWYCFGWYNLWRTKLGSRHYLFLR